ncbi:MAG: hypothetical protein CMF31_04320 [Kordiimonas sp.]|nr:hypothetical protein [Kordiimonas sp.]|tara:strand:+ start:564 stop:749 length:186 start_codon:yes stop_codon:yes gene_type:complete
MRILILIGLIIVGVILMAGIVSMTAGGEFNKKWGNKLMRARVFSQFAFVALLAAYFMTGGD